MLNADRLAKNRKDLLEIKNRIQALVSTDRDAFLSDPRNPLAVKYLLVEAVEAVTDTCQHLLGKVKGIACDGYVDCILKAGDQGILKPDLANKLRRLADLRNSLIHRYWIIDDGQIHSLCRDHIEDLQAFVDQVDRMVAQL